MNTPPDGLGAGSESEADIPSTVSTGSKSTRKRRSQRLKRRLRSDPQLIRVGTLRSKAERISAPGLTPVNETGIQYRVRTSTAVQSQLIPRLWNYLPFVKPIPPEVMMSYYSMPTIDDFTTHMKKFSTDGKPLNPRAITAALKSVSKIISIEGFSGAFEDPLKQRTLARIPLDPSTSPGIRWVKKGYRSKWETRFRSIPTAWRYMRNIRNGCSIDELPSYPCGYAGRGKLKTPLTLSSSTKAEGRLVLMPDVVYHELVSVSSKYYTHVLKTVIPKELGGVLVGTKYFGGEWGNVFRQFAYTHTDDHYYLCADFSGFDSSLDPEIIEMAFSIVRKKFPRRAYLDTYFEYCKREMIHTTVNTPSGYVYKKHKGVASGDPYTSLIGSYSNWIILLSVLEIMNIDGRVWVYGDDSVVSVRRSQVDRVFGDPQTFKSEFGRLVTHHFRMKFKPEQSYICKRNIISDEEHDPGTSAVSFLSYYCNETGFPVMSTSSLYNRLINPERSTTGPEEEYALVMGLQIAYYGNPVARDWLAWLRLALENEVKQPSVGMLTKVWKDWKDFGLSFDEVNTILFSPVTEVAIHYLYVTGHINYDFIMSGRDKPGNQ